MEIKKLIIKDNEEFKTTRVIYSHKAIETLLKWFESTHSKSLEFGFFGLVTKNKNDYIIEDFYLMKNTVTNAAYWESDETSMAEFFMSFPVEDRKRIRCFAHSHVRMGTNPSGTDNKQIMDIISTMVSDYMIQLIVNRNLENTVNIYDKENELIFNNVPQFVQLEGGQIIKFESMNKCEAGSFNIPDGDYKVSNGLLICPNDITFNFIKKSVAIGVGKYKLAFQDNKLISWIDTLPKQEREKIETEVNKLFEEKMPAKKKYEYGYGYGKFNYHNYEQDYEDYENFWKHYYESTEHEVKKYNRYNSDSVTPAVEKPEQKFSQPSVKNKWWQVGGRK